MDVLTKVWFIWSVIFQSCILRSCIFRAPVMAMRFTIDDERHIKWIWVKKITQLAQDVFDRRWSLDGVKTLIKKYKCEIFNFVNLCSGVGIVWSTTTRTQVNDATAVTFSVKYLNPLTLYSLSGNIFRKWFDSHVLFIHEHFIIMWSPAVNLIAVTILLLTSGLHRC